MSFRKHGRAYVLAFFMLPAISAMSAEYQFPADEPRMQEVSRMPMSLFEVDEERSKIRYKIPKLLTGVERIIEMDKVEDKGDIRVYAGDNVHGECQGPGATPICRLEFQNLNLDNPSARLGRRLEAERVFADPQLRSAAIEMGNLFAEQQPIGVIDGSKNTDSPQLAGKKWRFEYQVDQRPIRGEMCFQSQLGRVVGHYRLGSAQCHLAPCGQCPRSCQMCGRIDQVVQYGDHFKGRWQVANAGWGWVDWTFEDGLNFKGYYGFENQAVRSGPWQGWLRSAGSAY